MLGLFSAQPHSRNPSSTEAAACATSAAGRSDMRPAMGSATLPITLPSATTTCPPPLAASSFTASAICSSSVPATRRLWQSWATVVATAHVPRKPKPWTRPTWTLPVPRWRSRCASLARSRAGIRADLARLAPPPS